MFQFKFLFCQIFNEQNQKKKKRSLSISYFFVGSGTFIWVICVFQIPVLFNNQVYCWNLLYWVSQLVLFTGLLMFCRNRMGPKAPGSQAASVGMKTVGPTQNTVNSVENRKPTTNEWTFVSLSETQNLLIFNWIKINFFNKHWFDWVVMTIDIIIMFDRDVLSKKKKLVVYVQDYPCSFWRKSLEETSMDKSQENKSRTT